MYIRLINPSLSRSFFLFGARGTGKSSWLQRAFPVGSHLWIDLTDPEVERRYSRRPGILIDEWKSRCSQLKDPSSSPWIIVDEVQKIPAILDVAHVGIQRHKIRFALTGSSARKLKRGAANLLAGRASTFHLYPLTWNELGADFDLESYLNWGGLPEAWGLENPADRRLYLNSYAKTYVKEEIQVEQLVRKIEPFRSFLDVVGQVSGEVINIARISKEAGIEAKSGQRFFEILGDTLLGHFLHPWSKSVRKRQLQHPKSYLFDVGVWRALRRELTVTLEPHTSMFGRAFEHFIIQQVIALNEYYQADLQFSFIRTKDDAEVDLVIERPRGKPLLIEIKSSESIGEQRLRGFLDIVADIGGEGQIWCREARERELKGVRVLPWQLGLDELFQ